MNSLMTEAVLNRAAQGQRLLIVDRTMEAVAAHFSDVAAAAHTIPAARITRAKGRERIELDAGHVDFRTYGRTRGLSADVIVMYNERDLTPEEHESLRAVGATAHTLLRAED